MENKDNNMLFGLLYPDHWTRMSIRLSDFLLPVDGLQSVRLI
jgi:hypothetical protein